MTTRQTPDAVREALRNLIALYDSDEGCRSLPEIIAAKAALDSRAGDAGEESEALTGPQLDSVLDALNLVLAGEFDKETFPHGPAVMERAYSKLSGLKGRTRRVSATPAPAVDAQQGDDEGPCTDCEDTGITIQTERACSCDAGDQHRAPAVDAVPAGEVERQAIRNEIINAPETADFMAGVPLEAAHQRERWGADHDAGKKPLDWFWLIGFLAQKAADAAMRGDIKKAKHHTISTGAALANWHAALTGADIKMRPGISAEAQAAAEGRGALSLALQTTALSHGEGRK